MISENGPLRSTVKDHFIKNIRTRVVVLNLSGWSWQEYTRGSLVWRQYGLGNIELTGSTVVTGDGRAKVQVVEGYPPDESL